MMLNIFISVFAGILTSIIIYFFLKIFENIILPWYQDKVYKGLDIGGEWIEIHNYENLLIQESKITIEQNAHFVKGKILLAKKNNETNEIVELKHFRFSGEFYNNHLNLTCWNENRKQIGTHNYLIGVDYDGKEMNGFKTYYDIGIRKMRSEEIYWIRKENCK